MSSELQLLPDCIFVKPVFSEEPNQSQINSQIKANHTVVGAIVTILTVVLPELRTSHAFNLNYSLLRSCC